MVEQKFRLIDANLNRCREGLRVLEDTARFVLGDGALAFRLKTLRHEMSQAFSSHLPQLLEARNPGDDPGAFALASDEGQRENMVAIVTANAKRVQESLRVLEELAKLPNVLPLPAPPYDRPLGPSAMPMCMCGCGQEVARFSSRFRPGHDSKLTSLLLRVSKGREPYEAVPVIARRYADEWLQVKLLSVFPLPGPLLFQQARFAIYEAEKELTFRLLRRDKIEKLTGLYVIIDPAFLGSRTETWVAKEAISGGARVIQLRDKNREKGALLEVALGLREACTELGALFIVNDDPDLALASRADGVHLGQKDLPVAEARRILRPDQIIGCSTATPEEAQQAQAEGADYIGVGSIFPTQSKADTRSAGLETVRRVRGLVSIPIVAIGGINPGNVAEVIGAGADAVAVISAVAGAEDVQGSARIMTRRILESRGKAS